MDLVFKNNENIVTNSLLVAEKFGKEHKHVLDAIRELLRTAENSALLTFFQEMTYTTVQNKELPLYIMNRDGFTLLTMGFNGKKALDFKLEYINAFNQMEKSLKSLDFSNPDTVLLLAQNWKEEQTKRIEAERVNEENKPKVIFADAVSASKTSILIGELAKILKQNGIEMGQNRLFTYLRDNSFLISRKGTDFNMPTQKSMELDLFEIKETSITHSDGHITVNKTPKVTGKGQQYFINRFLKKISA
ncbi:phage regulatory protein/antirepressor Ant [Chryseobacterium sp.]|uniref:phage regulatory protein/antirepressor Ant n=1 Tax=Chryseobacterium sp. TaxID=1871047 RepID=UPI002898BB3A|nr:phage regulatory protein/antirepressor Ant [Chryseobacterium sp.]